LLQIISDSRDLQDMWSKYQRQFTYAADVGWSEIMKAVRGLCEVIVIF
jgi:hypothetical protein